MKTIFLTAVVIAAVIAAGSAVRPYWDNYWLAKDLEAGAVYGTKNPMDRTRDFLLKKLQDKGYPIGEENLFIEKDAKNTVTVTVRYSDKISIFGKEFKKLDFTATATAREVKAYF